MYFNSLPGLYIFPKIKLIFHSGKSRNSMKNVSDALVTDLADVDAVAIGSPNYNHAMMPTVRKFLKDIASIDLSGKVGLSFGSYGWSLEATDEINRILTSYGLEMIQDLLIKRMPGEEELELCRRVGSLLLYNFMLEIYLP